MLNRGSRKHTVDEVKQKLDHGDKVLLVDVREESEFAKDHLPGAIHLGKGVIERDIEARVPDVKTPMILYCGGGFRSAMAAGQSAEDGIYECDLDGWWRTPVAGEELSDDPGSEDARRPSFFSRESFFLLICKWTRFAFRQIP